MINWLGQDIVAGTVVYRGARQGDSSDFRVGVVSKVNEATGKVTVAWKWTGSNATVSPMHGLGDHTVTYQAAYRIPGGHKYSYGPSSVGIEGVIKVDDSILTTLEQRHMLAKAATHFRIPKEEFAKFEIEFNAGRVAYVDTP
ncbi:hypothetical protein HUN41_00131 [Streptomyces phage Coruscant]|uniref:Uncharacterized protein n=1 Tax=Streptomyces phage Coruscant TaxID=2739834 RepID=A0A7G4AW59_9CAUD|nr:hypothetical protein PP454_gp168 [Streptomyces phage Coruscant]QMP84249.1 hypothetical protein HUN41_00131 [Streptomyces phage Coruscant]